MLDAIRTIAAKKLLAYAKQYVNDNWATISAKGLDGVNQIFAIIEGKLFPENSLFGSDDPALCAFAARCDEIVAQAEVEAEGGS